MSPRLLSSLLVLFAVSCADVGVAGDELPMPADDALVGGQPWEQISRDGRYLVRVSTDPDPIPFNEPFTVDVDVFDASSPSKSLEGASVVVDAWMPDHGHGMNRFPKTEPLDNGRQRVRGMLFHMLGKWELNVDVIHENLSSRATFEITL